MPVRMRNGASSSLSRRDHLELRFQTFGLEPVRDRQLRRVIGEREVLVPELGRLARHLLDGGATVRPVGVRVEVAQERGVDRGAGPGVGRGLGFEPREVLGHLARERLLDHATGARPDPGQRSEATLCGERLELVDGTVADRVGGATERLFLVATGAPPLEQRGDAVECLHRVHHPEGTSCPARVHSCAYTEG